MIQGGGGAWGGRPKYNDVLWWGGGGDKSIHIITLKLSQNLLFRKEHITKPYLLKLGNWKAVAFLNTLKEHSTLFDIT